MSSRPDKPLVVKCTFDKWNKRITFSSARNCTYHLLRAKVEQCFSLATTPYAIAYKDDDGEITDITTDTDLTEAIQYFHAGPDDNISSAASILSGRSFGNRKITVRVHVTVDYDGPSLSDTSSLASLEEYKGRASASQLSFSLGTPSIIEQDDDSVTVSSRDTGLSQAINISPNKSVTSSDWDDTGVDVPPVDPFSDPDPDFENTAHPEEDPSVAFDNRHLSESLNGDGSSIGANNLSKSDRGAAWLRDQNDRALRSTIGIIQLSAPDDGSLSIEDVGGDLALEVDPRGKYYYCYTSTSSSQTHDSGYEDGNDIVDPSVDGGFRSKPRPTSRQLNWLASQQITNPGATPERKPSYHHIEATIPEDSIPPELLPYLPIQNPPLDELTDCSECGVTLDAMRYVCSTCGEKTPMSKRCADEKGKGRQTTTKHSYPPRSSSRAFFSALSPSSGSGGSSETLLPLNHGYKPLSSVPNLNGSRTTLSSSTKYQEVGYELCPGCIESAGVTHAIEAGLEAGTSPGAGNTSPSSPEDAQRALQWRRSAPKDTGKLRHAYQEKIWGHSGWEDVEQDESDVIHCSACQTVNPVRKCYRCLSCKKFYLCRACYSQVHDVHPSHAFLVVPDKSSSRTSDSDFSIPAMSDIGDEESLKHPGVKCFHCLLDIIGARFHCAICDDVDICSNCESVGLPGNLDSEDGGHASSHILIKIPYPLESNEVQIASKRAMHLWQGRDAISVGHTPHTNGSPGTVIGSNQTFSLDDLDHNMLCNGCNQPIVGVRYQCGQCVSSPTSYSLCADCEEQSYLLHDPHHIFFKLPRPVHRALESHFPFLPNLYQAPVGPTPGDPNLSNDPRAYLKSVVHSSAVCDRCVKHIRGAWFRCAYCGHDLCESCEEKLDFSPHVFLVFKAKVDMQAMKRHFVDLENPRPIIQYPVYKNLCN